MQRSPKRSLKQMIDWKLVICYLLLVLIGWLNIYASSHSSETAGSWTSQRGAASSSSGSWAAWGWGL